MFTCDLLSQQGMLDGKCVTVMTIMMMMMMIMVLMMMMMIECYFQG